MKLATKYEVGNVPHSEHPFPQAQRQNMLCLNGKWKIEKYDDNQVVWKGDIIVPFSPESLNSGVKENFELLTHQKLVYTRAFTLDTSMLLGRTVLHFGAVDSRCKVWINDVFVGEHSCGYTAFSMDVSAVVNQGVNAIKVECIDDALAIGRARGKQSRTSGGIWYTAQSGIWQSVWLESMPVTYIKGLKITPIIDGEHKKVIIQASSDGQEQTIYVFDGAQLIIESQFVDKIELEYDFELWSPNSPKLYDFVISNQSGDQLKSYFGVRTFGIGKDSQGKSRLLLNDKPYFFHGVLDQGYWSDGLLTPPSDMAMYDEIKLLKDMGFNTIRKHIKVEPMRWYYHCDKIGMVVWQDFVNGGKEYKFSHIALQPFLGINHRDDDYKYFGREDKSGRDEYMQMVTEIVANLSNCTCIGMWVPFNEGWGQFSSHEVTKYVESLDDTRIVDSVSGWHDQGYGKTNLRSLHTYFTPLKVPKDERVVILSEFGGYSLAVKGHTWNENKQFGYRKFKSQQKYSNALQKLYLDKLLPLISKGLCGSIYTQVSDVEEEINGLVTYDRKIVKIPISTMREISDKIYLENSKIK